MKKNAYELMKNFSFSIGANMISLIISTLMVLIVPKIIGIEEYGYWQLYMFYANYVGFFHFGLCDGLYLRYGGIEYSRLNKTIFSNQFWLLSSIEIVLSLLLIIFSIFFFTDISKLIVILVTIISITIVISKTYLMYILQATNRIKEYSILIISEKIVFLILVIVFLVLGTKSFVPLIIGDIIGKFFALIISVVLCKEIVFTKPAKGTKTKNEIKLNFSAGVKLMFANIAGLLIIGIVRMAIEDQWSIIVFGKISLSLSISNMLMVFINALGIVIFPLLKRSSTTAVKKIYSSSRNLLMICIFIALLLYYPFQSILSFWLPKYADSLKYMAILFPICVFETKMALLINTYLKAFRKEKILLLCNFSAVLLSIILTIINVYILHNLVLTVFSIVILFAFRCVFSEYLLSKIMKQNLLKDILVEVLLTTLFIVSGWFIGGIYGFLIYSISLFIYIISKKEFLKEVYFKFVHRKHV